MALMTQIVDGGEPRELPFGWGGWHLTVLAEAIEAEGGTWKDAFDPGWTFREWHGFIDEADGERLELPAGTVFRWWWS